MDATTSFFVSGMAGTPMDLVLYDEGNTHLIKTEIVVPIPLQLRVLDSGSTGLRAGRRVMLLARHNDVVVRADGHLDQIQRVDGSFYVDIGQVQWELIERRRHVRLSVSLPVGLRTVIEGEEELRLDAAIGSTTDISMSGAFVKMVQTPLEGSLIEFSTEIDGEPVKTLAVVAHVSPERGGVGLHFVEYLGNARFAIQNLIAKAA